MDVVAAENACVNGSDEFFSALYYSEKVGRFGARSYMWPKNMLKRRAISHI